MSVQDPVYLMPHVWTICCRRTDPRADTHELECDDTNLAAIIVMQGVCLGREGVQEVDVSKNAYADAMNEDDR